MNLVQLGETVVVAARDEELDTAGKKDAHCLVVPEGGWQPICPAKVVHG